MPSGHLLFPPEFLNKIRSYLFSLEGFFSGEDYAIVIVGFMCLLQIVAISQNVILNSLLYLMIHSIFIAATQKRCRDINIKGTWIILLVSIFFTLEVYVVYLDVNGVKLKNYFDYGLVLINLFAFALFLIITLRRSKNKNDNTLISPLLKHRYLYELISFFVYLCGYKILLLLV